MKTCWRALRFAVLGATVAGCIKIAPFSQKDAGGDDALDAPGDGATPAPAEVHWMPDGAAGAAYVTGFYNVHFASGGVFHYPDGIFINGMQVLGENSAQAPCNFEDEVGFSNYPAARIAPHGTATIVQNTLTPIWTGPAVVEIQVVVQAHYDGLDGGGSAAAWQPSVISRFSFHPDGRTYRVDLFDGTNGQITPQSASCDAGGQTQYRITSFATLAAMTGGTNATVYNETGVALTPPLSEQTSQSDACIDYGGMIQVAAAGLNEAQFRVRSPTPSTIAFVSDLAMTATPTMNMTRTALFFSRGGTCSSVSGVQQRAHVWQTTREMLSINNTAVEIQDDGLYGGFADNNPNGGFAADFPVTLANAISMPFAVWLITPATSDITVTKSSPTNGAWYQKQHDATGQNWVIWFRDPLAAGDTITIDRAP